MQNQPSQNRDPRRAYRVVNAFESELADYTGAPDAVAVNSCTNALLLALTWERMRGVEGPIVLPRRTYVGVLQSVLNAGFKVLWGELDDDEFQSVGFYPLFPTDVWDFARRLSHNLYRAPMGETWCLSFHAAKQLPLGRGGAILTDDPQAAEWFRAARMDGRPPGGAIEDTVFPGFHCPMPPDVAARGLDVLSRWNDAGYSPPPLPPTDYPDLSLIYQQVTA
jgi:dTDP-4-amino-4,6-dideoxygalactose transaminase